MTPSLIHCIYASCARAPFDAPALAELLHRARLRNAELGLTGMLLHASGSFFQVLEGEPDVVDTLYERIERDPRHTRVTRIIREPIAQRHFGAWRMGFLDARRDEIAALVAEQGFVADAIDLTGVGAGRARRLLDAFCDGSWRMRLGGARQTADA